MAYTTIQRPDTLDCCFNYSFQTFLNIGLGLGYQQLIQEYWIIGRVVGSVVGPCRRCGKRGGTRKRRRIQVITSSTRRCHGNQRILLNDRGHLSQDPRHLVVIPITESIEDSATPDRQTTNTFPSLNVCPLAKIMQKNNFMPICSVME